VRRNNVILLVLVLFLIGCENQEEIAGDEIIKRSSIDMSEQAVHRRWFEDKFSTSYSSLLSISGECIAWNRSGQCWYRFDVDQSIEVVPKINYLGVACTEIYSVIVREFENEKNMPDITNVYCAKSASNNDVSYWIREVAGPKNYIWDIYEVK
jgi:hypothetical protein